MKRSAPCLLNYFAVSNGRQVHLEGQLTNTPIRDLSFELFSTYKTVRSLIRMYRTKPLGNRRITLHFDTAPVKVQTDKNGAFSLTFTPQKTINNLKEVTLANGKKVALISFLYNTHVLKIESQFILVSDIDDTLLHSFIRSKFKKLWAMLLTTVEKRKPVKDIKDLIIDGTKEDAAIFYLSNSEQNLFPLIASFFRYNQFPKGPVLLKDLRKFSDLLIGKKRPKGNTHKINSLKHILRFFNEKTFILVGDNTQEDLTIYLTVARQFPRQISDIIIREVKPRKMDPAKLLESHEHLVKNDIKLHYASTFEEMDIHSILEERK